MEKECLGLQVRLDFKQSYQLLTMHAQDITTIPPYKAPPHVYSLITHTHEYKKDQLSNQYILLVHPIDKKNDRKEKEKPIYNQKYDAIK